MALAARTALRIGPDPRFCGEWLGPRVYHRYCTTQGSITPVPRIDDTRWRWHVGLDVEATALLDDLYAGAEVGAERLSRLVGLFRLQFANAAEMRSDVAGVPVYLALMANPQGQLRMKPQNLLLNLPLAVRS